jgi:hypothetical protein
MKPLRAVSFVLASSEQCNTGVGFANRHEFGGRLSDEMRGGLKAHISEFFPQTNKQTNKQNTSPVL